MIDSLEDDLMQCNLIWISIKKNCDESTTWKQALRIIWFFVLGFLFDFYRAEWIWALDWNRLFDIYYNYYYDYYYYYDDDDDYDYDFNYFIVESQVWKVFIAW